MNASQLEETPTKVGIVRITAARFQEFRTAFKNNRRFPDGIVLLAADQPIKDILPEETVGRLACKGFDYFLEGTILPVTIHTLLGGISSYSYTIDGFVFPYMLEDSSAEGLPSIDNMQLDHQEKFWFKAANARRDSIYALRLSFVRPEAEELPVEPIVANWG